ncbi:hypothetical protein BKA62DRAFT_410153 [Auriculariales sp. MPI-PUGE-AT-0066]|nr:hypothetical protein BKA62DRAFT_410153 [Auriculariales sp. MPI-PUGE-AT-0066]
MARPLRILALHGWTANASRLAERIGPIVEECGAGCHFVFLDGPHVIEPPPGQEPGLPNQRSWWDTKHGFGKMEGFDKTMHQGAGMTAILTAIFEQPEVAKKFGLEHNGSVVHKPFNFSIMFSGRQGIQTRSLHVIGKSDQAVPPHISVELSSYFTGGRVEYHLGGHEVPTTKEWTKFLQSWLLDKASNNSLVPSHP